MSLSRSTSSKKERVIKNLVPRVAIKNGQLQVIPKTMRKRSRYLMIQHPTAERGKATSVVIRYKSLRENMTWRKRLYPNMQVNHPKLLLTIVLLFHHRLTNKRLVHSIFQSSDTHYMLEWWPEWPPTWSSPWRKTCEKRLDPWPPENHVQQSHSTV